MDKLTRLWSISKLVWLYKTPTIYKKWNATSCKICFQLRNDWIGVCCVLCKKKKEIGLSIFILMYVVAL
jgi:hypothetical protein